MRGGIAGFQPAAVFFLTPVHTLTGYQRGRLVLPGKPDIAFERVSLLFLKCRVTLNGLYLAREADRICFDV